MAGRVGFGCYQPLLASLGYFRGPSGTSPNVSCQRCRHRKHHDWSQTWGGGPERLLLAACGWSRFPTCGRFEMWRGSKAGISHRPAHADYMHAARLNLPHRWSPENHRGSVSADICLASRRDPCSVIQFLRSIYKTGWGEQVESLERWDLVIMSQQLLYRFHNTDY